MNEGWIIFGLSALTLIGATLPLLYERHSQRRKKRRASDHAHQEKRP